MSRSSDGAAMTPHARMSCLWVQALFVVLFSAVGCAPQVSEAVCSDDAQCGEFRRCDVPTGECRCVDDRGCSDGEFCNAAGLCQPRTGCSSNADCDPGDGSTCSASFCDVNAAQCVNACVCEPAEGETCCALDGQCGFGQICNRLTQKCVEGCRSDGDCGLAAACIKNAPDAPVGACVAGACAADFQCQFGESCNIENQQCVFDTRGPYCASCSGGVASDDCGSPANYCLTDTSVNTRSEYCGVDCSQGQPCPRGFTCNDVIIIPSTTPFCQPAEVCEKDDPEDEMGTCSRFPSVMCALDEDCPEGPPGSDCPRAEVGNCAQDDTRACSTDAECCDEGACPEGSCLKQRCLVGEGEAFGNCSCTRDIDCPRDRCVGADLSVPDDPRAGACELSGHTCYEDIDCDVISCVNGGCLIGQNCAPGNDRNCRDVQARD